MFDGNGRAAPLAITLVNTDGVYRRAEPDTTTLFSSDLVLNNRERTYTVGGTEQD